MWIAIKHSKRGIYRVFYGIVMEKSLTTKENSFWINKDNWRDQNWSQSAIPQPKLDNHCSNTSRQLRNYNNDRYKTIRNPCCTAIWSIKELHRTYASGRSLLWFAALPRGHCGLIADFTNLLFHFTFLYIIHSLIL